MLFSLGPLGAAILLGALLLAPFRAEAMEVRGNLAAAGGLKFQDAGAGLLFSDGSKQTSAAIASGRVSIVGPVGTAVENGAALLAAMAAITDADADHPYLVRIEPGTYDIGTSTLSMIPYVDIEGSGRGITTVTGQISGDNFDSGVVSGASPAELRYLSVVRSGGGQAGAAIVNKGASPDITGILIECSGATGANIGIYNIDASPRLRDIMVGVHGGRAAYGIGNDNSTVLMRDGYVFAGLGTLVNIGVYNEDSHATMSSLYIGVAGDGDNFGVINQSGDAVMRYLEIEVSRGQNNIGIDNRGSGMPVMHMLTVSAGNGSGYNYGIQNSVHSAARHFGGNVSALGGKNAFGIVIAGDDTLVQDVRVNAIGGSESAIGIYALFGSPTLAGVTVGADGFGSSNIALYIIGDAETVNVSNSRLRGASRSIECTHGVTLNLGASQLGGAIDTTVGNWECSGCYDGSFASLGVDCN